MPPKKAQAAEPAATDGVPGKPAHPEYVNGYQVGHQDGRQIGQAEGRAAGLKEAGADATIHEAEHRGYQRGYQAAQDERRPPLFEAAKKICATYFASDDETIWGKVADLELERGETLSRPDQGLLEGVVRRHRLAAEAQRQALVLAAAKPKSEVGRNVARHLQEGDSEERAETVYDLVR